VLKKMFGCCKCFVVVVVVFKLAIFQPIKISTSLKQLMCEFSIFFNVIRVQKEKEKKKKRSWF